MTPDERLNSQSNEQAQIESGWVINIKAGNEAAFEMLFNFYCQNLINFARRYVTDIQIAENIVQDVFSNVWNHRENLNPSKMIKSYLFTSVKNEALKVLRHRDVQTKSRGILLDSLTKDADPEQELTANEINAEVHLAIDELPVKCREIFMMNRFDGLKYAEIAEVLGISVKTVEVQMGRALKKMRKRLKPFLTMVFIVFILLIYLLITN